jgi:hypothetical protein
MEIISRTGELFFFPRTIDQATQLIYLRAAPDMTAFQFKLAVLMINWTGRTERPDGPSFLVGQRDRSGKTNYLP